MHLVDVSSSSGRDPVNDYDVIVRELELFPGRDASGERLSEKPVLAAANKIDALDDPARLERVAGASRQARHPALHDVGGDRRRGRRRSSKPCGSRSRPRASATRRQPPPLRRRRPTPSLRSARSLNERRRSSRPARRHARSRFTWDISKPRKRRAAALGLDRVIVLPSRVPPHRALAAGRVRYHRFAMSALAVNGVDGLDGDDLELCAPGPSYTADTLTRFRERFGLEPSQVFFITGADAFAEIATWHRYPEVLDLAHFVVVSRPASRPRPCAGGCRRWRADDTVPVGVRPEVGHRFDSAHFSRGCARHPTSPRPRSPAPLRGRIADRARAGARRDTHSSARALHAPIDIIPRQMHLHGEN